MPRLTLEADSDQVLGSPVRRITVKSGRVVVYSAARRAFALGAGQFRRFTPPETGIVLHATEATIADVSHAERAVAEQGEADHAAHGAKQQQGHDLNALH